MTQLHSTAERTDAPETQSAQAQPRHPGVRAVKQLVVTQGPYPNLAAIHNILNTYQVQHVILDMILSGLFDRFPDLKIVSAENDVGWKL